MHPIPANATRIRYLYNNPTGGTTTASHSSGAAIDTGITPTSNLVVSLRAMFLANNAWGNVFGVESSDGSADGYRLRRDNRTTNLILNIGSYNYRVSKSGYVENAILDIECGNKYLTINGSKTTGTYSEESPQSNTLVVGCCRRNGNLIDYSNMRIYALKLYDGNSLVFDGVPVRVGDTGELFDRVTGTYATRSGTFVCGPDTFQQGVIPTRVMVGGVRKKAPPVRYLKFHISAQRQTDIVLQFSEVRLIDANDVPFVWPTGTTATAIVQGIDTSSTVLSGEEPIKALDGSVDTKYCSGNVSQKYGLRSASPTDFIIDLGASGSVDLSRYLRWQWFTADDSPNRDPRSFTFSSSTDGVSWKELDSATITPTTTRKTLAYTGTLTQ